MKKRKLKKKFVVFFSLYFILLFSFFSIISFSKFLRNFEKTGSISVAKWNVFLGGDSNATLDIITGNTTEDMNLQSYTLNVNSISEVASSYSIIITNVPDNLQVSFDDGELINEENNTILINNAGSFTANDANSMHSHKITFIAPDDVDDIEDHEIKIDVIFNQNSI